MAADLQNPIFHDVELRIPRLRRSSSFPAFLEPSRRAEKALTAVIQGAASMAYPRARWTTWCAPWGMEGVRKSGASRLCAGIDERGGDFLGRPIEGDRPTSG